MQEVLGGYEGGRVREGGHEDWISCIFVPTIFAIIAILSMILG